MIESFSSRFSSDQTCAKDHNWIRNLEKMSLGIPRGRLGLIPHWYSFPCISWAGTRPGGWPCSRSRSSCRRTCERRGSCRSTIRTSDPSRGHSPGRGWPHQERRWPRPGFRCCFPDQLRSPWSCCSPGLSFWHVLGRPDKTVKRGLFNNQVNFWCRVICEINRVFLENILLHVITIHILLRLITKYKF